MLDIHLVQPTNQKQGWKLALIHSPGQMSNLPGRVQTVNFLVIFLKSLANIASAVVMSPLCDLVKIHYAGWQMAQWEIEKQWN